MDQISQILNRYPWIDKVFDRVVHVLVLVVIVVVSVKVIHIVCDRLIKLAHVKGKHDLHAREREKRVATLVNLVDTTLRVVLFGAAILMVLREFGLDITPLLTGAGIAGVAVGFGAQSLVKDVISGFFILLEDQVRIGDVIKINGLAGAVERMELRITAIRDGDGTLHIIPNGEIKSVSNMTYDFATAVVSLHVPHSVDLKTLMPLLQKVATEFDADAKWKPVLQGTTGVVGITEFQPTGVIIQVTVKTDPHSRWSVAAELRSRIKSAADAAGINLSLPRN